MKYLTFQALLDIFLFLSSFLPFFPSSISTQLFKSCKMSVPPYTPGLPYYSKVDSITDATITYRMLYLEPNVKPESEKWQPRTERCCIAVLALGLISESYIKCCSLCNLCKLPGRFVANLQRRSVRQGRNSPRLRRHRVCREHSAGLHTMYTILRCDQIFFGT